MGSSQEMEKGGSGVIASGTSSKTLRNRAEEAIFPVLSFIFLLVMLDRVTAGIAMVAGNGSCNYGVSFGWFTDVSGWVWALVSVPVIVYLAYRILKGDLTGSMRWGVYIFFAGAVSNLFARGIYGCIWDWISVEFIDLSFTLADVYVDVGLFMILLGVILSLRDNG